MLITLKYKGVRIPLVLQLKLEATLEKVASFFITYNFHILSNRVEAPRKKTIVIYLSRIFNTGLLRFGKGLKKTNLFYFFYLKSSLKKVMKPNL
mgnify:CR=1 FL=1|tara:strand:+ start:15098 stop:15379 length:282 start_codon:yes stop_codon:yes gene_type:complete